MKRLLLLGFLAGCSVELNEDVSNLEYVNQHPNATLICHFPESNWNLVVEVVGGIYYNDTKIEFMENGKRQTYLGKHVCRISR